MGNIIKLIYFNFLLLNDHKLNTIYLQFIYNIVKDNYEIRDELFNFINRYSMNNDPRLWRIKLLIYQWAPGGDL
jgi:hypothetical protein